MMLIPAPRFLNDWSKSGFFGMVADFTGVYINKEEFDGPEGNDYLRKRRAQMKDALARPEFQVNIILASYGYENYSGDAFVLFEKDGKLYEVHGSHCSCYGLEDQWNPEETSIEALRHRLANGTFGTDTCSGNQFRAELIEVLDSMEAPVHPGIQ